MTPLVAIKLLHTLIWAFFAGCILAIPVLAWRGRFRWATVMIGVVAVECLILAFNGMRCPLTDLAAPYTANRADNFDIYLPVWLARWNKHIFGALYVAGILATWLLRQRSRASARPRGGNSASDDSPGAVAGASAP